MADDAASIWTRTSGRESNASSPCFSCHSRIESDEQDAGPEGNGAGSDMELSMVSTNTFRVLGGSCSVQRDLTESIVTGEDYHVLPPPIPPRNPGRRSLYFGSSNMVTSSSTCDASESSNHSRDMKARLCEDSKLDFRPPLYTELDLLLEDIKSRINAFEWTFQERRKQMEADQAEEDVLLSDKRLPMPEWAKALRDPDIPESQSIRDDSSRRASFPKRRPKRQPDEFHPLTFIFRGVDPYAHQFRPSYEKASRTDSCIEKDTELPRVLEEQVEAKFYASSWV
ncbi:hypothetical protein AC578_4559 [Pseudocercospora eumusae]|uniref:Uncharacterized protein n=1 Tax=Pseudocercospora eumusae TaxID=321146 RepID=A0A139HGD5_9PEZI|nr:hypothetical protein AC578_4559 [Pseudocercospora eumusae]